MAQPTNTYDSYDMVGIREDLSDFISDVSPEETPFYTKCGKTKATNTYHEWQTDSLRAPAANVNVEGDDTTPTAISPTTRLGNYTQIFKEAATVSDTDESLDKAGRSREMRYQIVKKTKELKRDIELALFANNPREAGSGSSGRELAGVPTWLVTNTTNESGNSGADPTGDGTDARTDDGTPVAFDQDRFNTTMQSIWTAGGDPQTVYLTPFQMNVAQGFTGNNNQRATIDASKHEVSDFMEVYATPWGTVEFMPSRWNRARDVFIMQNDKWKIAVARPLKSTELAKTGDSTKRQLVTELTLVSVNEAASGAVYDNTTS